MDSLVTLLIVCLLAAIVLSLGAGLFHLARGRDDEDSRKLARALTWRIAISLALFALLMIAWHFGLISPHGLQSPPPRHP
ncbi:MAG TPA: twin transmembrane helix small protein [Steroidobacteraceae bacterium]|nr:twin transmembrane helix small protein [Steroidobacteraceae bacterium]